MVMERHKDCDDTGLRVEKEKDSSDECGSSDEDRKFEKAHKKIGGGIEKLAEANQRT